MNKARWKYIKRLVPPAPRYLHVSTNFKVVQTRFGPELVLVKPGITYDIGRNEAKRQKAA